ncbi:hypothetical protein [Ruegeria aquimaris]|uniref:Uncharacterized protein n=1 Tax=Ruegeria aquimaris TaxID=2984333 RepID=A0ABT3APU2_9RHOB|nr:hypothetical protein [Ruegeria sp. XHP0148]MCV2890679.1 hypothetical protein [Ruegeria sp. XHP0148]
MLIVDRYLVNKTRSQNGNWFWLLHGFFRFAQSATQLSTVTSSATNFINRGGKIDQSQISVGFCIEADTLWQAAQSGH